MRWIFGGVVVVALFCVGGQAGDKLVLPPLFSEHMVLQQGIPVPVWGESPAGAEVAVTFTGQTKTVKADEQGRWKVALDPLKAEKTPAEMVIKTGEQTVTIQDVLVGEVWVCSGQSNMDYTLGGLKVQNGKATPLKEEIDAADFPEIRQFEVSRAVSPKEPKTTMTGTWLVCSPKTVEAFTATGFFFGRELCRKLGIPVGLIKNAWGGMPVEAYMSRETLENSAYGKKMLADWDKKAKEYSKEKYEETYKAALVKWEEEKKKAEADKKPLPKQPRKDPEPEANSRYPSTLYNAMVFPVMPYAIRGAIWYQGESNSGNPSYYETFPAMIKNWRQSWGQGEFPFYFVQLANFMGVKDQPAESGWALIRDAQFKTLDLPNTGMAVTIDIGEEKDIHPRNKIDVGKRLALWALAKDYKQEDVKVWSGPLFKSAEFKDGKAVITFDSVGTGLTAGKRANVWTSPALEGSAPERFAICGADKKWIWATAKITGADTVEVSAESVKEPVAVRYCWMDNPGSVPLLYNKEGLPATPFTTEKSAAK